MKQEIELRQVRRVAIFGTRFMIQSGMFGILRGVDIVAPKDEELEDIHEAYTSLIFQRDASNKVRDRLIALANILIERENAELIILAGTDFSAIFNEHNTPFPALDRAEAHIRAIVRAMD